MDEVERVPYDEFGMFDQNAEEFEIPYSGPPTVRRVAVELGDGRQLSALVWGSGSPELVFLHGGAQNAHTWDTVALALGRPLVAIDLPGHGHSDQGRNGSLDLAANASDVAEVIRQLAPQASAIVGMSLGGMTTLALTHLNPELVRSIVLVDVTPGVNADKAKAITNFINGPESFPSFDELLARTIEFNPTRTVNSLRRGILHNALQREDGSWVWRYARMRSAETPGGHPDFVNLWDVVSAAQVPMLLVRGMRAQSVVDDADEIEFLKRGANAKVIRVDDAGHSVQGDTPIELAQIIANFVDAVAG
jgi:pimeloyl-ACP methyl ester carboxylesterase